MLGRHRDLEPVLAASGTPLVAEGAGDLHRVGCVELRELGLELFALTRAGRVGLDRLVDGDRN